MEGVKDISSYLVHKLTQNVTQAVQQTQYDSTDISAVTDDLSHFKPTKSKKQNQMCDARDDKKKKKRKNHFYSHSNAAFIYSQPDDQSL